MHRWDRAPPEGEVASVRESFVCRVRGLKCDRLRLYSTVCHDERGLALRRAKEARDFALKCFAKVPAADRIRQLADWKA
eukprot:352487-Alexandrium_andersonii.AAC.1